MHQLPFRHIHSETRKQGCVAFLLSSLTKYTQSVTVSPDEEVVEIQIQLCGNLYRGKIFLGGLLLRVVMQRSLRKVGAFL